MALRLCSFMMLLVVLAAFAVAVGSAASLVREERSASEGTIEENAPCVGVCGWGVYQRFTRKISHFMKNPYCICPPGTECKKSNDDLSVSAYVYTCLESSKTTS